MSRSQNSMEINHQDDSDDAEYNSIMQGIASYTFPKKEETSPPIVVHRKQIADFGLEKVNTPIYQIKIK